MRDFLLRYRSIFLWILGGGFFVMYCILATRFTFWGDELTSIEYAKQPVGYFIHNYLVNPDNHPPLYYFLLNVWQKVMRIDYHNDYWFQIPSIFFYSLTIIFIIKFFLTSFRERLYFVLLTGISSYFFVYSHMVRYYTLAALMYVIVFFYLRKWLSSSDSRILWKIIPLSWLLAYSDYPSYIFYGVTLVVFIIYYKFWNKLQLKQLIVFAISQIVAIVPLLYLNYIYFTLRLHSSHNVEVNPALSIKKIINFLGGLGSSWYQISIGEYFNIFITPILIVILGLVFYFIVKEWKKKKEWERSSKMVITDLGLFIITNITFASFFLTFIIGRYPIFSFIRFLLPTGFFVALMLVKLFSEKRQWVIFMLIGVNLFTISMNIFQRDFINPIFFYPWQESLVYGNKFPFPILSQKTPTRPSSYVFNKYLPQRVLYQDSRIPSCFLLFTDDVRLGEHGVERTNLPEEEQPYAQILFTHGYDNISSTTKKLLRKFNLMNTDYKYYYSLVQDTRGNSSTLGINSQSCGN